MIVLVSGGRDYERWQKVHAILSQLHERYGITLIVQGEAKGADFCAKTWAWNNQVPVTESYKADWDTHGKAAGRYRNEDMIQCESPDLIVLFPGGKGTAHMRECAQRHEIPCLQIPDVEWEDAQLDVADVIITFDDDEGRKTEPFWVVPPDPSQRWARKPTQEQRERYDSEAMF